MISDPDQTAAIMPDALTILQHDFPEPNQPGKPNPSNAQAVIDVVARGVDLVTSGAAAALCTNPIHKKALKDGAGFAFPGRQGSCWGLERNQSASSLCGPKEEKAHVDPYEA